VEFKIYFSPLHAEPYYEYADFIIEDIPISSMKNPPEALKEFHDMNTAANSRIPMPSHPGANAQYLNLPLMHFSLRGQGNYKKLRMDPPVYIFEEELLIGQDYTQTIKLIKESAGHAEYTLKPLLKNSEEFFVGIRAPE